MLVISFFKKLVSIDFQVDDPKSEHQEVWINFKYATLVVPGFSLQKNFPPKIQTKKKLFNIFCVFYLVSERKKKIKVKWLFLLNLK